MEKKRFSDNDKKLHKFIISRDDLSDSRIRFYDTVFDELFELTGFSPSEIIDKCLEDQKLFLEDGLPCKKQMSDRYVDDIQSAYHQYLKNKKPANNRLPNKNTIRTKINTMRFFLKKHEIELPDAPDIRIKKKQVRMNQIPTWSDVDKAISYAKSPRDKAIIAFASTTGFRVSDIANLKIKDLIRACKIYFDEDEEHTLEVLLSKNPYNICPCWDFDPQKTDWNGNLTITYNTPETTKFIWDYLEYRIELNDRNGRGRDIAEDEALFKSQTGNHLDPVSISSKLSDINGKMGGEMDKNGVFGKFRIHNLRTLFSSTCKHNLRNINVDINIQVGEEIVELFLGHDREALSYVYDAVPEDSSDCFIRLIYEALIPYLSISRKTEVNKFSTREYQEFEDYKKEVEKQFEAREIEYQRKIGELTKENDEFRERFDKMERDIQNTSDKVALLNSKKKASEVKRTILDYYAELHGTHFRRVDLATVELAYLLAMDDLDKFNSSDDCLMSLINKSTAKLKFKPDLVDTLYENSKQDDIDVHLESEALFKAYRRIIAYLDKMGVWEMIKDNEKEFRQTVSDYLLLSDYVIDDLTDEDYVKIAEDVVMEYF